jgi:ssDNA-binding replication factor A large subunit
MTPLREELLHLLLDAGLTEAEIEQEVASKMEEFKGMMTERGIIYLIAKERGIELPLPHSNDNLMGTESIEVANEELDYEEFRIPITDVKDGMINVEIRGKIMRKGTPRKFSRKDGSAGMVGNFTIQDESGSIPIVVWNEQAKILAQDAFQAGEMVRILKGYAKLGQQGDLEMHIGDKGQVILNPSDLDKAVQSKIDQIRLSSKGKPMANEQALSEVQKQMESREFIPCVTGMAMLDSFREITTKDGRTVPLLKVVLKDDTSAINVNVWGEEAPRIAREVQDGMNITITNLHVKLNTYSEQKELNYTKKSSILVK